MDSRLPNFTELNKEDGSVYGTYDKVTSVNPYNCYFIVKYPDGTIKKGNNLFTTGWDDIPNGFIEFSYVLSTGHIIILPKFMAYMPLIEVSNGLDGSRIFHAINVKCLEQNCITIWRIILKQGSASQFKIGDIILSRENLPKYMSSSWKYTS